MAPIEITKAQLLNLIESDPGIEYMGRIQVGTETRLYYRTYVQPVTYRFKIVYIVE